MEISPLFPPLEFALVGGPLVALYPASVVASDVVHSVVALRFLVVFSPLLVHPVAGDGFHPFFKTSVQSLGFFAGFGFSLLVLGCGCSCVLFPVHAFERCPAAPQVLHRGRQSSTTT